MYERSKLFTLPLCEGEVRFSPDLTGLIAWLGAQDGHATYVWVDCNGGCLLAQFAKAAGYGADYVAMFGGMAATSKYETIAFDSPHTYSGALSRARRALRESER